MNQFLSNKIIAGIVAVALLVGVGVLVSSGDTSSTTRNAALVVATPCTKPGQVTKVSKQSVVCATTNTGSLWYATMKAKGKAQACKSPGAIRKKSKIVWVCGVVKKKKLWQATQPLPPAVVASTTVIEPSATQPSPALDSTQVATPEAPVVADNTVLADTKIPDDKIVTQVINDATTPVTTPVTTPATCATGGTCAIGDAGPGGGIVFYVAPTAFTCGEDLKATCTYLEAAKTDYQVNGLTEVVAWGCPGVYTGATATAIGTGKANTATILKKCTTVGIAADVANKYSTSTAGAGQWFLPSKDELNELCKYARNTGQAVGATIRCENGSTGFVLRSGFAADVYWSSSEYVANSAWYQNFLYGYQSLISKLNFYYVRPVRAFSATCATGGTCAVGDAGPGGGIVFYVSTTAQSWGTYLEAAPTDYQVNGSRARVAWGCFGTLIGAADAAIGAGKTNTATILAKCSDTGIAARVAADYRGGGKSDWFLPSKDELNELCKYAHNTGQAASATELCSGGTPRTGFDTNYYYSSTEYQPGFGWSQFFGSGGQFTLNKFSTSYVRPVRAF